MHNAKDFGAIADGKSHPVGKVYPTDWKTRFPHATSPDDETDWAAIQAAINALPAQGGKVYLPAGTYLAGDILIQKGIIFEGEMVAGNLDTQSWISVPPGKTGIRVRRFKEEVAALSDGSGPPGAWKASTIDPVTKLPRYFFDRNGTFANIRNVAIRGASGHAEKLVGDGIYVFGCPVKIDNVAVVGMGGHGIHIHGPGIMPGDELAVFLDGKEQEWYNANSWQVYNCLGYQCGQSGLFVEGGEAQGGLCVGFLASGNKGWGIYESSFLGNAYEGCAAEANERGSYKVDKGNYSTFTACYAEGAPPSFTDLVTDSVTGRVTVDPVGANVLILGGSLAASNLGYNRVHYKNSKLHFRGLQLMDEVTHKNDLRSIEVQIPASAEENGNKSALLGRAMWFLYTPPESARKFNPKWNQPAAPEPEDWENDPYANSSSGSWILERTVENRDFEQLAPPDDLKKRHEWYAQWYVKSASSLDRTWVLRMTQPLPNMAPQNIVPFGWTDRAHLRGPGHAFFVMPLANQRAHFTWRQNLEQLDPGGTTVSSGPTFPGWLQQLDTNGTDGVLAVFSIEAPLSDLDSDALNVFVGPHRIYRNGIDKHPAGTFSVRLFNNNTSKVSGLVLVAHFELYTTWTTEGY